MANARVAEVAIGNARTAQKKHLHKPVQNDRNLAEKEGAVEVGRQQDVIQHQQRDRQNRRGAEDVVKVGQRGEAPLSLVELEEIIDEPGIDDKARQKCQQRVHALGELFTLEADMKS